MYETDYIIKKLNNCNLGTLIDDINDNYALIDKIFD